MITSGMIAPLEKGIHSHFIYSHSTLQTGIYKELNAGGGKPIFMLLDPAPSGVSWCSCVKNLSVTAHRYTKALPWGQGHPVSFSFYVVLGEKWVFIILCKNYSCDTLLNDCQGSRKVFLKLKKKKIPGATVGNSGGFWFHSSHMGKPCSEIESSLHEADPRYTCRKSWLCYHFHYN